MSGTHSGKLRKWRLFLNNDLQNHGTKKKKRGEDVAFALTKLGDCPVQGTGHRPRLTGLTAQTKEAGRQAGHISQRIAGMRLRMRIIFRARHLLAD